MHLKKIKIITFLSLYCFFLLLLFSETFISDFQDIRRKVVLNASHDTTETLLIPKTVWNTYTDKGEIEYQNNYYDINSFTVDEEVVKAIAYKDSFELILKGISKNLNSKTKKSHHLPAKKTIVFYFFKSPALVFFSTLNERFKHYSYAVLLKSNFHFSFFRPPTLV